VVINVVVKSLRSLASRPVDDVLSLTKAYVKQETLGPLKGAGRWIAFGVAGALSVGVGVVLLMLSVLRFCQRHMHGSMSWAPYGVTLVVGLLVVAFVWFLRGRKTSIARKESK
jgi:hypothetical protein